MGHTNVECGAGPHYPPNIAEHGNIVDVLKNVLTEHVIKCIARERKRELLEVVYGVYAGKGRAVEIDPTRADIGSRAEI
jgi:hypothetical protein